MPQYQQNFSLILKEIKKKQEFKALDDEFVQKYLESELIKNLSKKELLEIQGKPDRFLRSREVKMIVKKVRAKLRLSYGMFRLKKESKITNLLKELTKVVKETGLTSEQSLTLHHKLLQSHRSTKERLESYPELYHWLSEVTHPKTILDLGCGLNPLAWIFLPKPPEEYHARELSQDDVSVLEQYFKIVPLKSSVKKTDLLKERTFPKSDLCLLLKVADVIEHEKRGVMDEIFDVIDAVYIVVSFATKTLSGRPMKSQRKWFEDIIKKRGWTYELREFSNEIFYLIRTK